MKNNPYLLTVEGGVFFLDRLAVDAGVGEAGADPEERVDVHADVKVSAPEQPLSPLTLPHLRLVRVH